MRAKGWMLLAAIPFFCLGFAYAQQEPFVLKVATVAPEGSVWLKTMRKMADELKQETGGRIEIKFFAGGVLGDDKGVLDKMRFGQIHAAGLTGVGLGELVPEVRVLELPFQYSSYKQVDCVLETFSDEFAKKFEEKGFVLLGWADQGFVYVFSKHRVQSISDMRSAKPWVWEADALARAVFKAVGVNPIPLALEHVFTSLQTGLVDTVYISPVAAIALQWYTKVSYMIDVPIADGSGAIVITKSAFDKLPADLQQKLREKVRKYAKKLSEATRQLNEKSIQVLGEKGITIVKPDQSQVSGFREKGIQAARSLAGQLYSAAFLERALKRIEECR